MQNSSENRSNSGRKSSENHVNSLTDYAPEIYKDTKEILNEGQSWRKIPSILFDLKEEIGASAVEIMVALFLAEYSVREGKYPTFTVGRSKIAEKTGLSLRAISAAVDFLSSNKVLFVRSSRGQDNQYTWNEQFILSGAPDSLPLVNEIHYDQCTTFTTTSERGAHIYIELSLDLFRSSLKAFFDQNDAHYKPYQFYTPGRRRSKKVEAAMASGSIRTVHRWEAWEEAAWKVWNEIKHENAALTRIFFALQAKNVETVNFPYKSLKHRVNDAYTQQIARKRSHLNLYCDEDVIEFLNSKYGVKGDQ